MTLIIGLAIGLILGGLVVLALKKFAEYPILVTILLWIGIIMVIFGIILLLTPVLVWFNNQIRGMLAS